MTNATETDSARRLDKKIQRVKKSHQRLEDKIRRCEEANKVIETISRHGRRFFYSDKYDRVSKFRVDEKGNVWLFDKHTGEEIYTHYRHGWRKFSDGGTLRALCEALRDYIRTGTPISRGWFGPWPDYVSDGDLWGYGKDAMEALRHEVFELPAVKAAPVPTPKPSAADLPSPVS